MRVIEESGQDEADDAMFREGESSHPAGEADPASGRSPAETSRAAEIIRRMPRDLSPARARSRELALELGRPGASTS